jgi:hypothetical protein
VLDVLPGLVAGLEFQPERLREAASDPALGATDLAEHLVREGVPFRRAHEIVGKLGRHARPRGAASRRRAQRPGLRGVAARGPPHEHPSDSGRLVRPRQREQTRGYWRWSARCASSCYAPSLTRFQQVEDTVWCHSGDFGRLRNTS